jgi:hypothetical protein
MGAYFDGLLPLARNLVCFLTSRKPGMSMVQLSKRSKIFQLTASQSATRGKNCKGKQIKTTAKEVINISRMP